MTSQALSQLIAVAEEKINSLKSPEVIIFHGSRILGCEHEKSDLDAIVISSNDQPRPSYEEIDLDGITLSILTENFSSFERRCLDERFPRHSSLFVVQDAVVTKGHDYMESIKKALFEISIRDFITDLGRVAGYVPKNYDIIVSLEQIALYSLMNKMLIRPRMRTRTKRISDCGLLNQYFQNLIEAYAENLHDRNEGLERLPGTTTYKYTGERKRKFTKIIQDRIRDLETYLKYIREGDFSLFKRIRRTCEKNSFTRKLAYNAYASIYYSLFIADYLRNLSFLKDVKKFHLDTKSKTAHYVGINFYQLLTGSPLMERTMRLREEIRNDLVSKN